MSDGEDHNFITDDFMNNVIGKSACVASTHLANELREAERCVNDLTDRVRHRFFEFRAESFPLAVKIRRGLGNLDDRRFAKASFHAVAASRFSRSRRNSAKATSASMSLAFPS